MIQGDPQQHPYDKIPTFHNLTHLELHDSWDLVARVLQYFPKLQNLKLYQVSQVLESYSVYLLLTHLTIL